MEQFLELLARTGSDRVGDETVVINEAGHCQEVVPTNEIVRTMAELRAEEATALNPLA